MSLDPPVRLAMGSGKRDWVSAFGATYNRDHQRESQQTITHHCRQQGRIRLSIERSRP
ncbi:hypothetical protein [Trichothermofontia sp.]